MSFAFSIDPMTLKLIAAYVAGLVSFPILACIYIVIMMARR